MSLYTKRKSGSTLMELIIAIVLFVILIPASLNVFLSARKVGGQSYVQAQAASTLGEVGDIIRYLRNQGFSLIENGEFYLIRNPGTGSWLVKSDLPSFETYERFVKITSAKRHVSSHQLYLEGDTGDFYEDPDTKKVEVSILWSPDYIPLEKAVHVAYVTNWLKPYSYESL